MKPWLNILSCTAGALLYASTIEAAPLHGEYLQQPVKSGAEWFSTMHQQHDAENPVAYVNEKFRNIPQGKSISLSFDEEEGDPFGLFSTGPIGTGERFHKKWIGLLFDVRTWNAEEDSNHNLISPQSTSAIPLPAGFLLFISGIGSLLLLGWLKKRVQIFRKDRKNI